MTLLEWAHAHWFIAGVAILIVSGGIADLLAGLGRRLGGCDCESCDCPPGCHYEPDDD